MNIEKASDIRDHGIAVKKGVCFSLVTARDAETGRDYVYAGLIGFPSMVVQLDVATGKCRAYEMPAPTGGPWGMAVTLEGHVLVTSTCGRIARLDPKSGKFWVTANAGHWLWSITRGMDGKYYLGTSTESRLIRYDAATEQVEDLGRLHESEQYLKGVVGADDGYVYGSIGTGESQIMAYHIASRRVTSILPESEVGPGGHSLARANDGTVYVQTIRRNVYRVSHGQAFLDAEATRQCKKLKAVPGFWDKSRFGLTLPDGRPVSLAGLDAIRVGKKLFPLKYETRGTSIFHLAAGPDNVVYASTIYPLHLVRYDPAKGKVEDLGRGSPDRAEAFSITHCDGKVYYGTYSQALMLCYDPAKPLHKDPPDALQWKTNPKLLGYLGKGNCRPRAVCVDFKKRVWMGGVPDYGHPDGGLASYDTGKKKLKVHDSATPNQSIMSLAADPNGPLIYGGTSIGRGGGLPVVAKEATLFAWDTQRAKMIWQQPPFAGLQTINNLLYRDGKVYGTTGKEFAFFRFDVKSRTLDYKVPSEISGVRDQSMCWGPDGNIYGITWMVLFRWRPDTGKIEELYRCMGEEAKPYDGSLFHRGAVIKDGRIYFSCGAKVMSMKLPLESPSAKV